MCDGGEPESVELALARTSDSSFLRVEQCPPRRSISTGICAATRPRLEEWRLASRCCRIITTWRSAAVPRRPMVLAVAEAGRASLPGEVGPTRQPALWAQRAMRRRDAARRLPGKVTGSRGTGSRGPAARAGERSAIHGRQGIHGNNVARERSLAAAGVAQEGINQPPQVLPRSVNPQQDWVRACKGGQPGCSDFSVATVYIEWLVRAPSPCGLPAN
jgi:hypothetical protein